MEETYTHIQLKHNSLTHALIHSHTHARTH